VEIRNQAGISQLKEEQIPVEVFEKTGAGDPD